MMSPSSTGVILCLSMVEEEAVEVVVAEVHLVVLSMAVAEAGLMVGEEVQVAMGTLRAGQAAAGEKDLLF